jgi:hypothetical protein
MQRSEDWTVNPLDVAGPGAIRLKEILAILPAIPPTCGWSSQRADGVGKNVVAVATEAFEERPLAQNVGGPTTWHVTDWDQRRVVSVTMDGEQDDDNIAIEHFGRYSSQLSPDVYRIYVSHDGEIISTYTDSKDDQNYCVHYPFLHEILLPEGIQTVRRDELEELERLGPDVDLVAYPPCLGESAKKVKSRCQYWIVSSYY